MGFFGKLMAVIRGFFVRAGDDLVSSSPGAIQATYAAAIKEAAQNYKEMERAVALLAAEREKTKNRLEALDKEEAELNAKLEGALAAAESDPENPVHREAGMRYLTRIQEIDEQQARLTEEMEVQEKKVEDYKIKLRNVKNEIDKLKKEEGEMVAEYISTQQVIQLEDRLKGIGESAVDESIIAIRDKVSQMKAQANIASEMRSATSDSLDQQYERMGSERLAQTKFDELLQSRTKAKEGVPEKERDLG